MKTYGTEPTLHFGCVLSHVCDPPGDKRKQNKLLYINRASYIHRSARTHRRAHISTHSITSLAHSTDELSLFRVVQQRHCHPVYSAALASPAARVVCVCVCVLDNDVDDDETMKKGKMVQPLVMIHTNKNDYRVESRECIISPFQCRPLCFNSDIHS